MFFFYWVTTSSLKTIKNEEVSVEEAALFARRLDPWVRRKIDCQSVSQSVSQVAKIVGCLWHSDAGCHLIIIMWRLIMIMKRKCN